MVCSISGIQRLVYASVGVSMAMILTPRRLRCQVNLKNQFVVTIDAITLRNNGKAPVATFQWCMLEQHMPRLAYLSVGGALAYARVRQ